MELYTIHDEGGPRDIEAFSPEEAAEIVAWLRREEDSASPYESYPYAIRVIGPETGPQGALCRGFLLPEEPTCTQGEHDWDLIQEFTNGSNLSARYICSHCQWQREEQTAAETPWGERAPRIDYIGGGLGD